MSNPEIEEVQPLPYPKNEPVVQDAEEEVEDNG